MEGPDSSYSSLEIHICWKVEREAKIDPPIQTEYLRSGGATIFTWDSNYNLLSLERKMGVPSYWMVRDG